MPLGHACLWDMHAFGTCMPLEHAMPSGHTIPTEHAMPLGHAMAYLRAMHYFEYKYDDSLELSSFQNIAFNRQHECKAKFGSLGFTKVSWQ